MKLPNTKESIEILQAKTEAKDMVDGLIERNFELEEIFEVIQPLLYALSVKLYAENDETITLAKLVEDAVAWISPTETIQ